MSSLSECASCGSSTVRNVYDSSLVYIRCKLYGTPRIHWIHRPCCIMTVGNAHLHTHKDNGCRNSLCKSRWEYDNQNNGNLTYSITTQPVTSGVPSLAGSYPYNMDWASCATNVIRPDSINIDMRVVKLRLCCPFPYELLLTLNPRRPLYTVMILYTMRAVVTAFTPNDKAKNAVMVEKYPLGKVALSTTNLIL